MDFFRRFYTGNEVGKEHKNQYKLNEKSSVDFHKISNKLNRISFEKKKKPIVSKANEKPSPFTQSDNITIKEQLWSLQEPLKDETPNGSSIKTSTSSKKQGKLRSDKSSINTEQTTTSTLYSPFTERPEIVDQDYIRLPTTKRSFIDPPVDDIMDSLPSLPYPFRVRSRPTQHHRQQLLHPKDASPSKDIRSRLDESPFEQQLEILNSQHYNTNRHQHVSPAIDNWLSSTLKQAEPLDINNFDEFGNLKAER